MANNTTPIPTELGVSFYQKLKQSITNKGYSFFDDGDFNLNFIWVRNDLHATNHFTDDLHIAYKENDEEKVLSVKCTTKPGLKGSLLNPLTVAGATGTAVIKEGFYRGAWQFIDSYKQFSTYPFFQQIKPINYWRDGDKDLEIDLIQEQNNKLFGTHFHRMSNVADKRLVEQFEINQWSLGCLGCPLVEWDRVISLMRKAVPIWGTIISASIVNPSDLNI